MGGIPGRGWDIAPAGSKEARNTMRNAKVLPPQKATPEPSFSPQQIRSIKQSPKGVLPKFLKHYA